MGSPRPIGISGIPGRFRQPRVRNGCINDAVAVRSGREIGGIRSLDEIHRLDDEIPIGTEVVALDDDFGRMCLVRVVWISTAVSKVVPVLASIGIYFSIFRLTFIRAIKIGIWPTSSVLCCGRTIGIDGIVDNVFVMIVEADGSVGDNDGFGHSSLHVPRLLHHPISLNQTSNLRGAFAASLKMSTAHARLQMTASVVSKRQLYARFSSFTERPVQDMPCFSTKSLTCPTPGSRPSNVSMRLSRLASISIGSPPSAYLRKLNSPKYRPGLKASQVWARTKSPTITPMMVTGIFIEAKIPCHRKPAGYRRSWPFGGKNGPRQSRQVIIHEAGGNN